MFQCSVNELAMSLEIPYVEAQGLKNFLIRAGLAKEVGSRPSPNGKGKPTKIYEFPERVELTLRKKAS